MQLQNFPGEHPRHPTTPQHTAETQFNFSGVHPYHGTHPVLQNKIKICNMT